MDSIVVMVLLPALVAKAQDKKVRILVEILRAIVAKEKEDDTSDLSSGFNNLLNTTKCSVRFGFY